MAGPERCNYPGSMSHGTRGEGPWYCRHHFFCGDAGEGARIVAGARMYRVGELVPPLLRTPPRPMREPGADESEAA